MMTEEETKADLDAFLGTPPDSPWRRRVIWGGGVLLVLALLLLLARCFGGSGAAGYITREVRRGDLNVTVSATGNLAPTNQVEVGSEVSGTVDKVLVDDNDRVQKGQTLAIIDTELLDDTIRQSRATLGARARRAQTFAPEEDGIDVGDDGHEVIERNVAVSEVDRAMARLPDEQREVIALVLVEGLAYKEAADILDIPMGTLTSRLVRGRQALLQMLEAA